MNSIEITRTNGNIPKALPNNDHISGLILTEGCNSEMQEICMASSYEGLSDTVKEALESGYLEEQVNDFFNYSNGATLYICIGYDVVNALKKIQSKANGEIRQVAIFSASDEYENGLLSDIKNTLDELEAEGRPMSAIVAIPADYALDQIVDTASSLRVSGYERISVVVGSLYNTIPCAGTVLGLIAAAAVNESISWVRKFPIVAADAKIAGTSIADIDKSVLDQFDQDGVIFFRTYTGLNGYYISDSHTIDVATSDYNTIESVRTMDKAVRGIRTYLLPELGAPLTLDPETGCLAPDTVKHLETVASQQLTAMEKAGEISGWSVEIDPAQNVLATSTVEFVIKNVPIGVMRKASVKIGYAQSV